VISQCIRGLAAPRLAWVLWLAMLLPLAQLAANWHVQSHWDTERSGASRNKDALAGAHCGVCVSAAAVTGGGAASTPLVIAHAPARQPAAQLPDGPRWSAPLLRAYESRAPPSLLG
jgi:hypothetical protein